MRRKLIFVLFFTMLGGPLHAQNAPALIPACAPAGDEVTQGLCDRLAQLSAAVRQNPAWGPWQEAEQAVWQSSQLALCAAEEQLPLRAACLRQALKNRISELSYLAAAAKSPTAAAAPAARLAGYWAAENSAATPPLKLSFIPTGDYHFMLRVSGGGCEFTGMGELPRPALHTEPDLTQEQPFRLYPTGTGGPSITGTASQTRLTITGRDPASYCRDRASFAGTYGRVP